MRKLGEHLDLPQTSRVNPVKWHSTHNKSVHKSFWIPPAHQSFMYYTPPVYVLCGESEVFDGDIRLASDVWGKSEFVGENEVRGQE